MNAVISKPVRIAILANPAGGGGMTKVVINLLKGLVIRGYVPDLVLDFALDKPYIKDVPKQVRIVDLKTKIAYKTQSAIKLVPPLVRYLREEKPDLLISHLVFTNVVVAIARNLAFVPVCLALVEHLPLANSSSSLLRIFRRSLYAQADAVIAVSKGMAQELETYLSMKPGTVQAIYNPIVDPNLFLDAQAPLDHPWFQANQPPVLLAVGRLTTQKDFPTLLHSFARLRLQQKVRLLILGEGELRKNLQALVVELGLENDVSLPGFVKNPYAYMSRAAAFVLSSRWEGLPTVLIEAIACGCQVVSTDCPNGPSEILAEGKYGRLVPVGDVTALAQAMQLALENPIDAPQLRKRSQDFSIERSVSEYLQLIGQ